MRERARKRNQIESESECDLSEVSSDNDKSSDEEFLGITEDQALLGISHRLFFIGVKLTNRKRVKPN